MICLRSGSRAGLTVAPGEAPSEEDEDPPIIPALPPVVFPAGRLVSVSLEASGDSFAIGVLLSVGSVVSLEGVGD